jgi:hypothetical protein
MSTEHVKNDANSAGFTVEARMVREPDAGERPRQGRQAYVLARQAEAS